MKVKEEEEEKEEQEEKEARGGGGFSLRRVWWCLFALGLLVTAAASAMGELHVEGWVGAALALIVEWIGCFSAAAPWRTSLLFTWRLLAAPPDGLSILQIVISIPLN